MAKYAGRKGVVYMSTTGTGAASNVASLSSWSLDKTTDKIDVTSFTQANKTYVIGLPDVKGNFSGFWDDTESKIFDGAESTDGVKLYLYPSSDAASKYWYGPAWVDYTIEVGVNDAVKITATFSANGSWDNQ